MENGCDKLLLGVLKMNKKEKQIISGLIAAIVIMVIMNICGSITASKKDSYEFDPDTEGSYYVLNHASNDEESQTTDDDPEYSSSEATTESTTEEVTTEEPTTTTEATTTEESDQGTGASYNMNATTGYMFPDSDSRVLTTDELKSLTKEEARYAKNEIYARNHYIFKSGGDMEAYFKNKDWYSGQYSDQDDVLYNKCNATERKNILNLKKYE